MTDLVEYGFLLLDRIIPADYIFTSDLIGNKTSGTIDPPLTIKLCELDVTSVYHDYRFEHAILRFNLSGEDHCLDKNGKNI